MAWIPNPSSAAYFWCNPPSLTRTWVQNWATATAWPGHRADLGRCHSLGTVHCNLCRIWQILCCLLLVSYGGVQSRSSVGRTTSSSPLQNIHLTCCWNYRSTSSVVISCHSHLCSSAQTLEINSFYWLKRLIWYSAPFCRLFRVFFDSRRWWPTPNVGLK